MTEGSRKPLSAWVYAPFGDGRWWLKLTDSDTQYDLAVEEHDEDCWQWESYVGGYCRGVSSTREEAMLAAEDHARAQCESMLGRLTAEKVKTQLPTEGE